MKICLIAPLFDPWLIGGAERYVMMLADALYNYHEVIVITTIGPSHRSNGKQNIIEIRTKNICSLYDMISNSLSIGTAKKSLWHLLDIWNPVAYKEIKNILDKENPDLIHTNGIHGFSSSLFSAIKHLQIPNIHTTHDYELISKWSSLFRKGKPITRFNLLDLMYIHHSQRLSSTIDAVISPSKFVMDLHGRLGFFKSSKKYIVPNGMKLENNIITPNEYSGNEFLYIGQIVKHKGPQIAIEAFKKLKEKNAKLHIVGNGSYLEAVKRIAEGDERIIFHGFIENKKDLDKIFNRCSYVIFPSIWFEVFGLVIIEAMNRGLPVIASNIGAIPELIKDGYNGFLFEPGDVDSLHSIIEDLVNRKRISSSLGKNVIDSSKNFSMEKHLKSILDIYNQYDR
jgi:glycosyltransferase involved in cell wall biosynthesis